MSDAIDWTLWRSLLAVVDHGSLSAAARRLGLTQPTLGRHIDALEARLGKKLFLRSPQGFHPTDLAQHLAAEARIMAHAARTLERRATGPEEAAGRLRLATSELLGTHVLPRLLAPFLARHPGLRVDLAPSDQPADLLNHEADLAIRMVRPAQGSLIGRRLGEVTVGLHARRDYLDRTGRPERPEELLSHLLIGPEDEAELAAALAPLGGALRPQDITLRSASVLAQVQAVLDGVGIGAMQNGLAAQIDGMERVLPAITLTRMEVWLVLHPDARGAAPLRLLADHLLDTLPAALGLRPGDRAAMKG